MSPEVRLAEPAVLARRLIDDTGPPIDTWAVAALLESRGIRDLDARDHYREADVFGLARRVHALTRGLDRASAAPDFVHAPLPRLPVSRLLARGGFFIVALAVQFISLLVAGYSQWASLHFTRAEASTVAVAAAASFIVTAGFGGAIGYLSPYFSEPRKYRLTRQIVLIIFGLGLIAVAVGALALCLLGSYVVSWPGSLLRAGLGYYALFAVSTLSISMLYVLREYAAMLGTSIVGILVAAGMHEGLSAPIRYAQWAGIGASIALALGVGVVGLGRLAGRTTGVERFARLPRAWTLLRLSAPHFIFASLYFTVVVADRIVGWSAGHHPLPVWFQTPYELGLDWALVSVVVGLAFLEITVAALARLLKTVQDDYGAEEIGALNQAFLRFWRRHLGITLILLVLGAGIAFGGIQALDALGMRGLPHRLADPITRRVFALGVAAYILLAVGLSNGIFLFAMARPWLVVRAMAVALAASLAVGVTLSRSHAYWWSAAGTVAGGLVFALLTGLAAWRTLQRGDLHLYAAY
jgi:hypothetical protein